MDVDAGRRHSARWPTSRLEVPDVVLLPQAELDALAAGVLGGPATGGTARDRRADVDRLGSLLDVQRGLPDIVSARTGGPGGRPTCGPGWPT